MTIEDLPPIKTPRAKNRTRDLAIAAALMVPVVWAVTLKPQSIPTQPVAVPVTAEVSPSPVVVTAIAPSPVPVASPVAMAPSTSPVVGIGITRQEIQTVFEKPEVGFSFKPSSAVDGQPRVVGTSANGLASVELIGSPGELVSASIMVGVPSDKPQEQTQNAVFTLGFMKLAAPEWTEGKDWLSEQLGVLTHGSTNEAVTVFGKNRAELIVLKEMGLFILTIKPNQ